jgi:hypothetical protein
VPDSRDFFPNLYPQEFASAMVAEVNEQSAVSRRAFLVGMVATGVAVQTKDAIAEDDNKPLPSGPISFT